MVSEGYRRLETVNKGIVRECTFKSVVSKIESIQRIVRVIQSVME